MEEFKQKVIDELIALGGTQEDIELIKEATIRNAIQKGRKPKDVAWAIMQ